MNKIFTFALAGALTCSLVACGSSSKNSDLSKIDQIKESGVLTMMTATGYPPFEYLGADGHPAGIDMDLGQMIADELGVDFTVLDMDFNLLVESLKSGKGDLVAAGMCSTEERKEQVDFSIPYSYAGQSVVVRTGTELTSADQLYDMTVGVQESTTNHIYVTDQMGITPLAYKNAVFCADALLSGKIDCIVLDTVPSELLAASYSGMTVVSDLFDEQKPVAMGIKKGDDDFAELVNTILSDAVADGTIDALFEKHIAIAVSQ